jgi:hypothetical protein
MRARFDPRLASAHVVRADENDTRGRKALFQGAIVKMLPQYRNRGLTDRNQSICRCWQPIEGAKASHNWY